MVWLEAMFVKYPEVSVYLAIGLGYLIGKLKVRGVGLGAVTGSLVAGILIGNFFYVPITDQAKSMLFLLFLFGIGYSVGPAFFRSLKGDGWRWVALGVFVPVVGLLTAYAVARFLKLDPGYAAGLLSGGLTESPAIGTASEAIRALSIPTEQKETFVSHIAVADAICYLFGTLGVIWWCAGIAPKVLGIEVREECKKLEAELGVQGEKPGVQPAWRGIEHRAYRVVVNGLLAGKTVAEIQTMAPAARIFVERVRREGKIFVPDRATVIGANDTMAIMARTEVLVHELGPAAMEVADLELLQIPVASFNLFVTEKKIAGRTLQDIVDNVPEAHGVFLRSMRRGEESIPIGNNTVIERGDILEVMGSELAIQELAPRIGTLLRPFEESDLSVLGLAVFGGVLFGAVASVPIGSLKVSLGASVGTLLAGVLVGWARSVKPWFGKIPDAAILFMRSMGLAAFVAMVGLKAGPLFLPAVREHGLALFAGGVMVTLVPMILGLFFGRHVLKLSPGLLLGGLTGAQTSTAAAAALQEKTDSGIPMLGYSCTVAFGHILLTTWGTVIVALMS